MVGATLICSDEGCAEVVDVVAATLAELELLACESCGCSGQVVAIWEVVEARAAAPVEYVLPLAA